MPEIAFEKLLTLEYWLQGVSGTEAGAPFVEINSFFYWFYLNLFALAAMIAVALWLSKVFLHPKHPFQSLIPLVATNLFWGGIVGLSWFTFRQINFSLFGARFWLLVMGLWASIVLYFIIRHIRRFYFIEAAYYNELKKKEKAIAQDS
jgi:hypothetical protein